MSEQPVTSPTRSLNPGTVLDGRYEILGKLGEGGFAVVYRARQINIQRDVAIKVLSSSGVDSRTAKQFEERFLREARTAARINHPNVVNIFDFGFTDGLRQPFIAMELLQGHDLEEELEASGAMDVQRAVPLFLEALEALGEAHKKGIIHKDLKPSNLFLCHPGSRRELVKVVDFGIARINESKGKKLTGTGQILGTPQYLAPEYIQAQIATPSLDVYQMGLILIELLTGKAVVDFDNPYQCLMAHGSGTLEVPASLINGALGAVLLRALEHDHNARFRDADDFYHALKAVDLSTVEPVDPADIRHKISEVSGSLRQVAVGGIASTGQFNASGPEGVRELVNAHDGGGMGSAETMAVGLAVSDPPERVAGAEVSAPVVADVAQSQPIPVEPQPSSNRRTVFVGLSLLGVFLVTVLVAAVVMFSMRSKSPRPGEGMKAAAVGDKVDGRTKSRVEDALRGGVAVAPPETSPKDPVAAEPVKEPTAPQGGDDGQTAPAASAVEVAIVPTPVGAEVFINGESVGKGRVTHRFEKGEEDKAVTVKVVAQGFVQRELELDPGQGPEVAVALKRKQVPRTPRHAVKKPAPEPKPQVSPPREPAPKKPVTKKPSMGFVE